MPKYFNSNIHYEVVTGSVSYGVSNDMSDTDIVSWVMPHKNEIFPHLGGYIHGFGKPPQIFNVYQKHHIDDPSKKRNYDITIYSFIKYMNLCMENNPNMLDTLFTPRQCVLYSTSIGEHIRSNRKLFLHKGSYHKYRGYAYQQMSKINTGRGKENSKRKENIEKHGYDTKYATHLVRLLLQVEQIMLEGDLDIQRNSEILKTIRNGEWDLVRVQEWFYSKEKSLEDLYSKSTLRAYPDENIIKKLLLDTIEMHYGSVSNDINMNINKNLISDIENILIKYK